MAPESTMRDVVQRLRSANSGAVIELVEFEGAIEHAQQHLTTIGEASLDIYVAAWAPDRARHLMWVRERAGKMVHATTHLIAAFTEMQRGIRKWDLGTPRDLKPPGGPNR